MPVSSTGHALAKGNPLGTQSARTKTFPKSLVRLLGPDGKTHAVHAVDGFSTRQMTLLLRQTRWVRNAWKRVGPLSYPSPSFAHSLGLSFPRSPPAA